MSDSIDKQLSKILSAEAKYKDDTASLVTFWEDLWANGGLQFNGTKWTFHLVDLYYKQGRYDDAFKMLNDFVISKPQYLENTRKWQIKILKKEKKDYAHIQRLLDNNQ